MPLRLTVNDLYELHRYRQVLNAIVDAAEESPSSVELDLARLAVANPVALVEAVLLARTLGVTLVLVKKRARR